MYTLTVVSLLVAQALAGYVGEHNAYHGPQAKPVVLPDGFLADTHDVAAAKNLHLGALSQASAHSGAHSGAGDSNHHDDGDDGHRYHGPHAVPKVLPDGHIADTHEVSAAKEAHLAALANAKVINPGTGHHDGHESHHHDSHDSHHHDDHNEKYHGPLAKPVVLPSGHLADTHEVAAAKGAHLGALAHAGAHHH